jgi:hypothetical protein
MAKSYLNRAFPSIAAIGWSVLAFGFFVTSVSANESLTVAETPTSARTSSGEFISWREHRIDDQDINGGVPIRGGDGIAIGDIDGDGLADLVTAHEDSNHIRIAFSTAILTSGRFEPSPRGNQSVPSRTLHSLI